MSPTLIGYCAYAHSRLRNQALAQSHSVSLASESWDEDCHQAANDVAHVLQYFRAHPRSRLAGITWTATQGSSGQQTNTSDWAIYMRYWQIRDKTRSVIAIYSLAKIDANAYSRSSNRLCSNLKLGPDLPWVSRPSVGAIPAPDYQDVESRIGGGIAGQRVWKECGSKY